MLQARNPAATFDVFDTVPIGVFVLDAEYRILFWNECLERWTGRRRDDIRNRDARLEFPVLAAPGYARRIADVFSSGVPAVFSPQLHPPLIPGEAARGVPRVQSVTVTSLSDQRNSGFLAVVSIQDHTDLTRRLEDSRTNTKKLAEELKHRTELEAQLVRAKDAAEQASRAKSQFLAVVSHEMRTPLNGVMGMAELLLDSELSDEQREMARTMHDSGNLLLSLINDTLDLAKIEANRITLEHLPFDVRRLVNDSIKLLSPQARCKGLRLEATVDEGVPKRVAGDPTRMRQVLLNLIGNAVKFTERGEVGVHVSLVEHRETADLLRFDVTDSGIGIDESIQAQIFQPFVQADLSTTRRFGGTGLGLAVCKRLIELMDGEIGVVSSLGRGSQFWFVAPFGFAAAQSESEPQHAAANSTAPDAEGPRLLVAEDNAVNQRVAVKMLQKLGYRAETVSNGLEALHAVTANRYAAVLMDCAMPVMDGFETAAQIRRHEGASHRTPIIALTANAGAEHRQQCMAAGMDDFVTKPLELSRLAEVLDRVLPS